MNREEAIESLSVVMDTFNTIRKRAAIMAGHIGKSVTVKGGYTDMEWMETLQTTDCLTKIKNMVTDRMSTYYPYDYNQRDEKNVFNCPMAHLCRFLQ